MRFRWRYAIWRRCDLTPLRFDTAAIWIAAIWASKHQKLFSNPTLNAKICPLRNQTDLLLKPTTRTENPSCGWKPRKHHFSKFCLAAVGTPEGLRGNKFSVRVRQFTEWPGPLHWIAFHWMPPPLFNEKPFFHWKVLRYIPFPKIGSYPGSGFGLQEYQESKLSSARIALLGKPFWSKFRYRGTSAKTTLLETTDLRFAHAAGFFSWAGSLCFSNRFLWVQLLGPPKHLSWWLFEVSKILFSETPSNIKGQQLKGKIVSECFALFHTFFTLFTLFQKCSPSTFPSKQRVFSSRRKKEKKR